MRYFENLPRKKWGPFTLRPGTCTLAEMEKIREMLKKVRLRGEYGIRSVLSSLGEKMPEPVFTNPNELRIAAGKVSGESRKAILLAMRNIDKFHTQLLPENRNVEILPGLVCGASWNPLDRVGLYIPGGTAPLFSTLIMLGVPARIAGVKEIAVSTPLKANSTFSPELAFIIRELEIDEVLKLGGIPAIGALGYGFGKFKPVNKIFGPGNKWVTGAKSEIRNQGVEIDFLAGPSELVVLADKFSNPEFIAADLIAQAEHGPDSQVFLVTDSKKLIREVVREVDNQILTLPRKEMALKSLKRSFAMYFTKPETGMEFINNYAPEHLSIQVKNPARWLPLVRNAGSVFLGSLSCEVLGDYASGTNHCLPTGGFARVYGGVSTESFMKKMTWQTINRASLLKVGPPVRLLARLEGLEGHANSILKRLQNV
jgi:histidinol dehydrogenase